MNLRYLRNEVEVDVNPAGFVQQGHIRTAVDTTDWGTGVVTKLGEQCESPVKVGDKILYLNKTLQKVDIGGCQNYFVFEGNICAIIEE